MDSIESSEVEQLLYMCKRIKAMIQPIVDAVRFIDSRADDIARIASIVSFRQRYTEREENDD